MLLHLQMSSVVILVTSSAVFRLVDTSNIPFPGRNFSGGPSSGITSNFRRAIFLDINWYVSHKVYRIIILECSVHAVVANANAFYKIVELLNCGGV